MGGGHLPTSQNWSRTSQLCLLLQHWSMTPSSVQYGGIYSNWLASMLGTSRQVLNTWKTWERWATAPFFIQQFHVTEFKQTAGGNPTKKNFSVWLFFPVFTIWQFSQQSFWKKAWPNLRNRHSRHKALAKLLAPWLAERTTTGVVNFELLFYLQPIGYNELKAATTTNYTTP